MEGCADYGILVRITSGKDTFLFIDGIDRERYMTTLVKALGSFREGCGEPEIAGLGDDSAEIFFRGGSEEHIRYLMRTVHASYASYRKVKGCRVYFGRTFYELLDGEAYISRAVTDLRKRYDYICTPADVSSECIIADAGDVNDKLFSGKISERELSCIALKYAGVRTFGDFLAKADSYGRRAAAEEMKRAYDLTYKEIGYIFGCSTATAYRLVNNTSQ